uniref:Vms1-associating treble clef domain-containing protein n=1 Tax=Phytophthora ramorum TaxID=164328 RepID=H3HC42_PHYRM
MIRSVRGDLVAPEDVGLTLPHEHVLHTIGSKAASKADLEIKMEDLIVYRRSPFAFGGRNLQLQNEDEAFRELERLQQLAAAIGQTRKPLVRLHLAERLSGLHLLTVTTFEIERINDAFSIGLSPREQSERIAKVLEAELMFGIESGGAVAYPGAMYQQIQSSELGPKERILVQGLALYRRYGGGGYTYLFEIFKQRLLMQGVTTAQWDQIVCGNVVDLLAWYVAPEAPPIPKNYLQCSICGNFFEPIEGEYFTKFAFIYCGTKCLRRHSRQKFAPLPTQT